MHDEKNQKESAVITVASKEGRKTMENKSLNINDESSKKRTKLTVHEVAKGMQGITLIALVVTILFSYDEKFKFSNSKGFLLQTI